MTLRIALALYLIGFAAGIPAEESAPPEPDKKIDPAVVKQGDRSPATLPERDIQFVVLDVPYEMEFFRADPRLFEQQFVATLRIEYPKVDRNEAPGFLPLELRRLWYYPQRGESLFQPGMRWRQALRSEEYFEELARRIPREKRPSNELIEILSSGLMHLQFMPIQGSPPSYFEFRVLAPTRGQCEELARALLTLLNEGLCQPSVEYINELKLAKQKELAQQKEKQDAVAARLEAIKKELDSSAEVDPEALPSLMTQQHLLEVDLAGVKARIAAAERILSQPDQLTPTRIEQVENIKITAEIELAGLVARQRTLQRIVEKGKRRDQLEREVHQTQDEFNRGTHEIKQSQASIRRYGELPKEFGPLRLATDNKVPIQHIQWRERE